jgi:predicted ATP-binding protein involved in virulence
MLYLLNRQLHKKVTKQMTQETATEKKKRIKQISVTNLFGTFNHTIPLHLNERITIIYGPNGFGKTMILKLLDALFSQDNQLLRTIPFDEFRVDFDDNTSFWVTKSSQEGDESLASQHMTFFATGEQPFPSTQLPSLFMPSKSSRVGGAVLRDTLGKKSPKIRTLKEQNIAFPLSKDLLSDLQRWLSQEKESGWLAEMRKLIAVHLLETQRLLNVKEDLQDTDREEEEQALVSTIQTFSEELAAIVKTKLAEYANVSQLLDSTFPERALHPISAPVHKDESELRRQLAVLEEKRLHLVSAGLLDQGGRTAFASEDHIDESQKSMLSVYIEDTEQKLSVLDNLFEKIHLFTEIINKRFLYKSMTIDKQQGFVFTTSKQTTLPAESLSSGEQHELILFYELLFKVAPGSLILIDEPELSLHIVWQKQFLGDVRKVIQLSDTDVLIATHAPSLIHDCWDLTVGLEEPNN